MPLSWLGHLSNRGILAIWVGFALVVLGLLSGAYAALEADWRRTAPEMVFAAAGVGEARTRVFSVDSGTWEFCPAIEGVSPNVERQAQLARQGGVLPLGGPGLRVSLYSADGVWIAATSGQGGVGLLRCQEFDGPGEFEIRTTQSFYHEVEWSLTVQSKLVGVPEGGLAEGRADATFVAQWRSDFTDREPPAFDDENGRLVFASASSMFSAFFRPTGDVWSMCWTLRSTDPQPGIVSSATYFFITLLIEEEPGDFGQWEDATQGEAADCVDVQTTQPRARHWLLIREGSHERSWELELFGVELVE